LLVRYGDVSPKSFVCPRARQVEFDGTNPEEPDLVELWDFGSEPYKHVSYSYHNPYGGFPAHENLPSDFATLADMNPWFKEGDIVEPGKDFTPPKIIDIKDSSTWPKGNSINHRTEDQKFAEGQNVLYVDGHASYEKGSNVGINHDNIYTFWSAIDNPSEQDIQGGTNPTSRSKENDAKSKDDSFLAI
jgi:prepilin-type processing-associated H-X9-DG protein